MTTKQELLAIADLIERFVDGSIGPWEWDDFISLRGRTMEIEKVRQRVAAVRDDYPPEKSSHWCSAEGVLRLRQIAKELRD